MGSRKTRIVNTVSAPLQAEITAAAQAEGKSVSAYLAGLVSYADDYLTYRERRDRQIHEFECLCAEWTRDLLALRASEGACVQEYAHMMERLVALQRLERLMLSEG